MILPIKASLLGGYPPKQTEEYILGLEDQLRLAQSNYEDKAAELKERIDAISAERGRLVLQERAASEKEPPSSSNSRLCERL
jgi:hypothetical protein